MLKTSWVKPRSELDIWEKLRTKKKAIFDDVKKNEEKVVLGGGDKKQDRLARISWGSWFKKNNS